MHKIYEFYKKIYLLSPKFPKKDRFGIYLKIEDATLELFNLVITVSLEKRTSKLNFLHPARIRTEVLKRLLRLCDDLRIVENNRYIELEEDLQEISKMINGWIKYLS